MDALSRATVSNASAADPGTVQGAASVSVMKKALNLQASAVDQLIQSLPQSLPQPGLATSGAVGTQVNAYA